ncbi:hypothetical protein FIBSPDRAFT_881880 [Athelia psychrophila]|uniref:Uncharacterized protein n=1 Tax=Athelia psychrophila TaxID=1759441 RepID=A0A166VV83_9AGAM|nr:hypothetical protein FIBSPDRAFT_881880 [Fibularhizoctonia sp. CBS 109695]
MTAPSKVYICGKDSSNHAYVAGYMRRAVALVEAGRVKVHLVSQVPRPHGRLRRPAPGGSGAGVGALPRGAVLRITAYPGGAGAPPVHLVRRTLAPRLGPGRVCVRDPDGAVQVTFPMPALYKSGLPPRPPRHRAPPARRAPLRAHPRLAVRAEAQDLATAQVSPETMLHAYYGRSRGRGGTLRAATVLCSNTLCVGRVPRGLVVPLVVETGPRDAAVAAALRGRTVARTVARAVAAIARRATSRATCSRRTWSRRSARTASACGASTWWRDAYMREKKKKDGTALAPRLFPWHV